MSHGPTTDAIIAACRESMFGMETTGWCRECGEEYTGGFMEPDAENYPCQECGANAADSCEVWLLRTQA